jgi:chromosome segregation ATPase
MVETIMYLAIGFLISALLGLMIMPLVHNRAVRLTTKRLEAATPLSMAEIQADKDQLRAEFAMSARRLEMMVEQLKNKTVSQSAELGKKSDAINRLKIELGEKNAAIFALEAREKALRDELRGTENEFNAKAEALQNAEQALAEKQRELAQLSHELTDRSATAESRQVELAAVRTEVEALQARVREAEREFADTEQRLTAQRGEFDSASRDLGEARSRVENLTVRVAELDRELMTRSKETATLTSRISDLEGKLVAQGKVLSERTQELGVLQQEIAIARQSEQTVREQAAMIERLQAEKAALEEQLLTMRDERARLQREIGTDSRAGDPAENALLRERINDIAAEVARLAITLEGPDSPIEAILASEPAKPAISAIVNGKAGGATAESYLTLAQRIRALQDKTRAPARPAKKA